MARIGLLTGGGDCPGLNAAIRAVVRRGLAGGEHEFVGFLRGWAGVMENDSIALAIGGDDTLGVALRLHRDGVPVVGVPKTIDNDLGGTDVTFGFQTAVQIVTDARGRDRATHRL